MPKHPVQQPEWIDSAPLLVEESVTIAASPAEVWEHIADHESWPEWFEALDEVQPGPTATGIGGTRRVIARKLPIDEVFTAWDPGEHFAFAVVATKLPILGAMAESVQLAPIDVDGSTGCLVTYRQGLQAKRGFGWVLDKIWANAAKQLPVALEALKDRVEADD